jgi:hypothetical protein
MACSEIKFPTQIFVDASGDQILNCLGIFSFAPDQYTDPVSSEICPLNVRILVNKKGDLKLSLLDDTGCVLDNLVFKCGQFEILQYTSIYVNTLPVSKNYVIVINARNLHIMGEYVSFEEKAYYYRRVKQAYTNLWCGMEGTYDPDLLNNIITPNYESLQSLSFELIKSRVVALKQLCECGKVCNNNFPPTAPICSSFKKYCQNE